MLNVPCLILRDTTERPITITQGINVLVGNSLGEIIDEASKALASSSKSPSHIELWEGVTAERIAEILASRS